MRMSMRGRHTVSRVARPRYESSSAAMVVSIVSTFATSSLLMMRVMAARILEPPIEPMLAKVAEAIPPEGDVLYEPKWDGFRAIVFRHEGDVFIQSRDSRPLDRYFPELHDALIARLPDGCVIDGEI